MFTGILRRFEPRARAVRVARCWRLRTKRPLVCPLLPTIGSGAGVARTGSGTGSGRARIATALIDTGLRMDEVIFEEFKGTVNADIVLDRRVADKRVYPAIDIQKSGTRKEDLLVDTATLQKMWILRRILNPMGTVDAVEFLLGKLKGTKNNAEFFQSMNQ